LGGFLLINPNSGRGGPSAEELAAAARDRGIVVHVLGRGEDAGAVAVELESPPLGIAGGDGSLAPVAQVAIERNLPFVCVPFGTRNHFAGDLGLNRHDPIAALAAFGGGHERRIDVARVNDRLFLNNASLGAYAGLVHRRERHRRRRQVLAQARALARTATDRHQLHARIDGDPVGVRILLVANNGYELDAITLGARPRLDEGKLYLYAAGGLLPRHWSARTGERFTIELDSPQVRAATDGEPLLLEPPLEFEILPRALRVLVPPERDEARL
jgi:diacylglycerol kinase family enzyme